MATFDDYCKGCESDVKRLQAAVCEKYGVARAMHAEQRTDAAIQRIKLRLKSGVNGEYDKLHGELLLAKIHLAILNAEFD